MNYRLHLTTAIAALSTLAMAQTASAQLTDEIIVTAQKKSQSLQDVAVSVTAYSGDSIQKLGLENSTSLAAQTPGLNVGTPVGEGNNPSFTLRGVGLNDFNDNNEGPIAVYTDEVYNAALPGLTFQLFDVDRVEVLRGPQGTLYGRNATGGLLHFVSKRGGDEFEADFRAQYGRFNAIELEGGVGGPLAEGVHYRLAGKVSESDPYVENTIGADGNESGSVSLRGIVDFDIQERGNFEVKVDYSDADTAAPQYQNTTTDGAGGFGPTDRFGFTDTDGDNFSGQIDRDDARLEIESVGVSGNFKWDFGGVQLTNIASFRNTVKSHGEDTDAGPFNGIEASFGSNIDQFSNEFRLAGETGRLGWVAGAYYLDTKVVGNSELVVNDVGTGTAEFLEGLLGSDDPEEVALGLPLVTALDILNGIDPDANPGGSLALFGPTDPVRFLTYDVDYTQNTESFSFFANVDYDLTENLELVLGGRYSNEKRDIEYINAFGDGPLGGGVFNTTIRDLLGAPEFFNFTTGGSTLNFLELVGANETGIETFVDDEVGDLNQIDEDDFSFTAGLNYTLNNGTLLYAKVAQGFKSGGFNAGFIDFSDVITPSDIPYENEKLTSYEGGVKWTSPGGNIRANASAFYYDYSDYQALTFSGLSQFIQNSDAEFYGGEAEVGATLFDGFTVQLGASYVDTNVDSVETRGVGTSTDVNTVLAPEFTANGVARYEADLAGGVGSAQISFNHQGSHFFNLQNTNRESAYTLFDGRLGYSPAGAENFEFYAFGKNIFDKEYRAYSFNFDTAAGLQQEFFGRPAEYGVGIIGRF